LAVPGVRRLNALFKENAEFRALAGEAGKHAWLQKIWAGIVPPALQPFTQAGGLKHRRITVFADNGAVAAKLKLLAPNLLKNLQNKGVEVTSIRVEVQVKSLRNTPPKPVRNISPAAAASLSGLAEKLADSPLRSALEKLARRS
jgi:hypothetical protein